MCDSIMISKLGLSKFVFFYIFNDMLDSHVLKSMKKFNTNFFKNLNYKTKQLKKNLITQIISHLITMHIDISIDPYQKIHFQCV